MQAGRNARRQLGKEANRQTGELADRQVDVQANRQVEVRNSLLVASRLLGWVLTVLQASRLAGKQESWQVSSDCLLCLSYTTILFACLTCSTYPHLPPCLACLVNLTCLASLACLASFVCPTFLAFSVRPRFPR